MGRFTSALVATVALSLAAVASARPSVHVPAPAVKQAHDPLVAVCQTTTTQCCWTPFVCDVVYKLKTVLVQATCSRQVRVHVPCYLARTAVGGTADAAAPSAKFFNKKCFVNQTQEFACTKERTIKEAYPKVCYKKTCTTAKVPVKLVVPHATVLPQPTAVPVAAPSKHNGATIKGLFGSIIKALLQKK